MINKIRIDKTKNTVPKTPLFIGILIFSVVVLTVYLAIESSSKGAILADLERQKNELIEENNRIKSEFMYSSSLMTLQETAESLGYKKPEKIIYTGLPEPMAKLP